MSSYLDIRDLAAELTELIERDIDPDDPLDEDEEARIHELQALEGQLGTTLEDQGNNLDPTMIADVDFEDYARELAEDCGLIPDDASWPASYIDWERAADALRMDYTVVTFDGQDWLIRA